MVGVYGLRALAIFLGIWSFGGFMAYFQGSANGPIIVLPIALAVATIACLRQANVVSAKAVIRAQRHFDALVASQRPDWMALETLFSAPAELRPMLITVESASGTLNALSDDTLLFKSQDGLTTARIRRKDVAKIEDGKESSKIRMHGAPYFIEVMHSGVTQGGTWHEWHVGSATA